MKDLVFTNLIDVVFSTNLICHMEGQEPLADLAEVKMSLAKKNLQ